MIYSWRLTILTPLPAVLLAVVLLTAGSPAPVNAAPADGAPASPATPTPDTAAAPPPAPAEPAAETLLDEWTVDALPQPVTPSGALNIQPFRAEYQAIYNGKAIGRATLTLSRAGADFAMAYRMKATRGLASFVGANLEEEGRFRLVDGMIQPLYFRHQSKAFLSKTTWHARFDPQAQQVSGDHEGDAYSLALNGRLHDPLSQFIYGAKQSLRGIESWDQPSVVKGEMRPYHFQRDPLLPLATQCAALQAWRVVRSRDESTATQEVWYSPGTGAVPVRIRNTQRDGDVLDLGLTLLEVDGHHFCGAQPAAAE